MKEDNSEEPNKNKKFSISILLIILIVVLVIFLLFVVLIFCNFYSGFVKGYTGNNLSYSTIVMEIECLSRFDFSLLLELSTLIQSIKDASLSKGYIDTISKLFLTLNSIKTEILRCLSQDLKVAKNDTKASSFLERFIEYIPYGGILKKGYMTYEIAASFKEFIDNIIIFNNRSIFFFKDYLNSFYEIGRSTGAFIINFEHIVVSNNIENIRELLEFTYHQMN